MELKDAKLAIIGLGYVGLPLAVEFSKKYPVIGFDINKKRIDELSNGDDFTLEVSKEELADAKFLSFSCNKEDLKQANVFIVTVPTPIDEHKQPDLTPLIKASEMLGGVVNKGDIIIYESTVYPGATEEDCIPVVEKVSNLKFNEDFYAGYSPERINPGDKEHRVINILKVTSGSTPEVAEFVDNLYASIITAGTHKASSIKVAEASKVIENIQRDVNIALINELHQIFTALDIDTNQVIEAASTKWNFMKLSPGLVGGHCISVDPYYLVHKSQTYGYIPDLIKTARIINDGMPNFVVSQFVKFLILNKIDIAACRIVIIGFAFKENCPDIRNTKVVDVFNLLKTYGFNLEIWDPLVDPDEAFHEYGLKVSNNIDITKNDIGISLVKHSKILESTTLKKFNMIYEYKG